MYWYSLTSRIKKTLHRSTNCKAVSIGTQRKKNAEHQLHLFPSLLSLLVILHWDWRCSPKWPVIIPYLCRTGAVGSSFITYQLASQRGFTDCGSTRDSMSISMANWSIQQPLLQNKLSPRQQNLQPTTDQVQRYQKYLPKRQQRAQLRCCREEEYSTNRLKMSFWCTTEKQGLKPSNKLVVKKDMSLCHLGEGHKSGHARIHCVSIRNLAVILRFPKHIPLFTLIHQHHCLGYHIPLSDGWRLPECT